MPYISITTSAKMTENTKTELKTRIGAKIPLIEGKEEAKLIINIADGCEMYMRGEKDDKIAFVNVKLFRKAKFEDKEAFVKEMYATIKDILDIEKTNAYINVEEYLEWGTQGEFKKA
ncbi:MAG: hypothetical protein R3Y12_04565 [Clostridia bacterium]